MFSKYICLVHSDISKYEEYKIVGKYYHKKEIGENIDIHLKIHS